MGHAKLAGVRYEIGQGELRETQHSGFPRVGYRFFMETTSTKASLSMPSVIALIAALASFAVGPTGGFILALVAIAFGLIGVMLSFSSHIRGGLLSIFSIIIGGVAILVAVIRAVGRLL